MSIAFKDVVLSRGYSGKGPLQAQVKFDLGIDRRILVITARRQTSPAGLLCNAQGGQVTEDGLSYTTAHGVNGDFQRDLSFWAQTRATEKSIQDILSEGLEKLDAVTADAIAYYRAQLQRKQSQTPA